MPYADPADKLAAMKRWREDKMKKGYGKWLYARRKLRFQDAENFKFVLEWIIEIAEHGRMSDEERCSQIAHHAREALRESREAEEKLGNFKEPLA